MGAARTLAEKSKPLNPFAMIEAALRKGGGQIEFPDKLTVKQRVALAKLTALCYYMGAQEQALQHARPLSHSQWSRMGKELDKTVSGERKKQTFEPPRPLSAGDREKTLDALRDTKAKLSMVLGRATPEHKVGALDERAPARETFDRMTKGANILSVQFQVDSSGEAAGKFEAVLGALAEFYRAAPPYVFVIPSGVMG